MHECRICNNTQGNSVFTAREMMYGTREEFEYFQCASCGCLQITTIPSDLSKYYPPGYYSHALPAPRGNHPFQSYRKRKRTQQWLGQNSIIGRLLAHGKSMPAFVEWARNAHLSLDDAILDIGSGAGQLLLTMHGAGFTNLTGADPFNAHDLDYGNGVRILKHSLAEIEGAYDFVMLHHSFEHMPDPLQALKDVYRVLKKNRCALIRIPLAQSYAWKTYGVDWAQLDAPRHLYLHTEHSIGILAKAAGFEVTKIEYDSGSFQFWGSMQYQYDIPLNDPRSFTVNPAESLFTQADIKAFEARAKTLNETRQGDQACFYLHKP